MRSDYDEISMRLENRDIDSIFLENKSNGYILNFKSYNISGGFLNDNTVIIILNNNDRLEFLFDEYDYTDDYSKILFMQADTGNKLRVVF